MPADAWVKSRLVHKPARGNVFALLFGAVALTGVLAAVGMQTLTGPVTTITRVTQKNIAETQLLMDARIIINAAVAGTAGGDADTDGFIEPVAYVAAASGETPPTNGGFLPTTLGLSLTDPWGNKYGYCVWDHGSTNSSANRITGDNNATNTADQQPVIALISAGPDRVFQTPCPTYSAGNIMDVQRAGDDIVQDFTYAQASANSNGLWSLNPSDQTKAELKSSGAGGAPQVANVSIDRDTGIGEFLGITTDSIVAKTDTIDVQGGLKLDSNYQAASATCTNAQEGAIRYNSGAGVKTLEVCNGTDWIPAGSDIWKLDGTNVHLKDNANNVGIGLDNPSEKLDVSGNIKASGNLAVGGTADVVGNFAVNTDKFTINATNGDTLVAGNLGVTGNGTVTGTLGVTGAGTFDSTVAVAGDFTINTDKFTVAATSGNTAIAGTLGVGGDVDVGGGKFTIGAATGNTAVAGTLNVTGDTALSANLAVTGNETVSGTLSVTGNTAIDTNTLYVDATANAVGIGTTSPAAALDVAGAIKVGSQNACDAGGANNGTVRYESSTKKFQICVDGTWNSISSIDKLDDIGDVAISEVGTPSDNDVLVWDASNSRWVAKNIAMVGPAQVSVAGVDGSVQFKEGSDLAADDANFHYDNTNNRLGLGTNTPGVTLDVVGAASVSGNLTVDTNTLFVDATNNMVGIGTLAPASALDISGAVKLGTQATCDAGGANDGTLRFNGTKLQLCLSGTWGSINSGGNGMAGDVPDAIDCGTGGYRRVLYLQSTNATQYLYQLVAGAAGIGMQVVYSAADGSHVSTTNTAGWANADGCDGKSFATLTDEGRSFYFMDGQGAVGAGGAPQDATYITQTPNLTLSNEQALSTLATGIVKVTTGTGVLSSGAVDLSGAEATGTLAAGRFPALTGDVTTSAGSLATTIAANAVTSGKIADGTIATIDLADGSVTLAKTGGINTGKLLGRSSAGAGAAEELSVGSGLSLSSGTLSVSGVGASSITPDSLDFTEFKDAMALDASTDIATGAYTLSITNDGTGNSLVVNDNGASDATPFVIDASGNVGIGAPTPVAKLDIVGGARVGADATCTAGKAGMLAWNANALQVCLNTGSFATISSATGGATASGADGSIQFATSGVLDSDPTNLYWDKANHRLGINMTTPRKAMDVNGYIVARNRVTFANDGTTTSPIWNIDNSADTLRIFREPDMSTPGTVYMTINNSGYVGIGPASATSPFHVAKTMTMTTGANYLAYKALTVSPTVDGSANYYADYNATTMTSDNVVNAVFGQLNGASHTGAGAITNFVGGQNQVYNSGTATVTYGYGGRNLYFNNAAGATTTSAFGADNGIFANVDGPTITNAYGAYNRAVAATGTTAATLVTNAFGAYNTTVNNGTGGITAAYGSYNALSNNDAGAITSAYGAFGTVVNALGGTITNGYGLLGRINNAGTGTITTGKSLQLDMLNSGGGSIGTWYGLYIPAISGTAPTTGRYPVYVADTGNNYFAGNVGIGNAAPNVKLHIGAGITGSIPDGAGTAFTPQVQNTQTTGVAGISVMVNDGTNNRRAGLFVDQTNSVWGLSTTYTSGGIPFVINNGGSEQLRVTSAGNVGVGTTAPAAKLTINNGANSMYDILRVYGSSTTAFGALGQTGTITVLSAPSTGTDTTSLQFHTSNAGAESAAMTILGSGNVGIGTTNPYNTLHVHTATDVNMLIRTGIADTTAARLHALKDDGTTYIPMELAASKFNFVNGNVGIGTTGPVAKLDVNGGARVGADATCTAAKAGMLAWNSNKLQVCTDAGTFTDIASSSGGSSQWVNGTSGAIYYNSGNVGIGIASPGAPLDIRSTSNAATGGEEFGLFLTKTYSANDTSLKQGVRSNVYSTQSGTISNLAGFLSIVANNGAGTVTNATGFWSRVDPGSAGGTITQARNFYAIDGSGSGTIGTQYGLYVDPLAKGTDNYAVYTAGTTKSYFGGNVGIVTAVDSNNILSVAQNLTDPTAGKAAIWAGRTVSLTANNAQAIMGISGTVGTSAMAYNTTGIYRAVMGTASHGGSGTASDMRGVDGVLYNTSTGTITNGSALRGTIQNLNASGVVTNAYGINVDVGFNLGTITNTYGVYVGDVTSGTQTNQAYGLYVSDANARNYFAGSVGIGTTSPAFPLVLGDTSQVTQAQIGGSLPLYLLHSYPGMGFNSYWDGTQYVAGSNGYTAFMTHDTSTGKLQFGTSAASGTAGAASTISTRMTIDNAGYVGIGTTSPNASLTVNGLSAFGVPGGEQVFIRGTTSQSIAFNRQPNTGAMTDSNSSGYSITHVGNSTSASDYLGFGVYNGAGASIGTALAISGAGKVGVGASTFGTLGLLQVAGDIGMTGNTAIRQSTAADGNTLSVYATKLSAGETNSRSYDAANTALLNLWSSSDAQKLMYLRTNTGNGNIVMTQASVDTFNMNFVQNSVSQLYLKSDGKIGIGTTTPQSLLDIAGGARVGADATCTAAKAGMLAWNSNKLQVCTDAGTFTDIASSSGGSSQWVNGASGAIYYNSGNVGIGTATPASPLNVVATNTQTSGTAYGVQETLSVNPASASTAGVAAANFTANYNSTQNLTSSGLHGLQGYANLTTAATINSAYAGYGAVQNQSTGTITSGYGWRGIVTNSSTGSIGTAYGLSGLITNVTTGTIGTSYELYLNTTNPAGTITNQYGVYQNSASSKNYFAGNVGIGTTSPNRQLEIAGASQATNDITDAGVKGGTLMLSATNNGVGSGGTLAFSTLNDAGTYLPYVAIKSYFQNGGGNGLGDLGISLRATTTDTALTERIRIKANGNVGIGTVTPAAKLDVAGTGNNMIANHAYTGTNSYAPHFIGYMARGTEASPTYPLNGDPLATFQGRPGAGSSSWTGMTIVATEDQSATAQGSQIRFQTTPNGTVSSTVPRMTIDQNGNVGIGTTTPNEGKVEVKGGTVCVDTNSDDSATSCIASESDARLKKNVEGLGYGLDTLMKLRPVSFDWKYDDAEVLKHYPLVARFAKAPHSVGFIAQEVQKLVPEAIESETVGDKDVQYFQLDYTKIVPVVTRAVQELKGLFDTLSAKVADLAAKLADVVADVAGLKDEVKSLRSENAALKDRLDAMDARLKALEGAK